LSNSPAFHVSFFILIFTFHLSPFYNNKVRKTPTKQPAKFLQKNQNFTDFLLSKYARIPPSSAGGMNGLPSPLGGEG
jgi:hypothetical protein